MAEAKLQSAQATDEALVERIAQGDQQAFADLYDRHAPRLLGLLVRWFPNRSDAEDVLQDVFWQVWKTSPQYSPQRGSVAIWLYLLSRSRSVDYMRRQDRATTRADLELPAASRDAPSLFALTEQAVLIREALSHLPDEQRRAIHLGFFCGLTHEQIAETEGIPLGTAKTRIWLAIRRLRNLLKTSEVTA